MALIFTVFILCLVSTIILTKETRWVHICPSKTKEVSCQIGEIIEVTEIYSGYRESGCSDDFTGSITDITNCSRRAKNENFVILNIAKACKQTNVCNITAINTDTIFGCFLIGVVANFNSFSFICTLGPSSTASPPIQSHSQTQSTASNPKAISPGAQGTTGETPDYTIPLAAGAGGGVFIVLILFLVTFCYWRKRGDQSINKAQPKKEDVSYVNMSKVDENRKSAPRIKEEKSTRPDVTATALEVDQSESGNSSSDPRGLYALSDKSFKRDAIAETVVDRSDTESNQAETSFVAEDHQNQFSASQSLVEPSPKGQSAEKASGFNNMGYVNEPSQYAEIALQDSPDKPPAAKRHVQFEEEQNEANEDRDIPEDFSKDSVALHRERSKKEVPSVIYAEVNKPKPQE